MSIKIKNRDDEPQDEPTAPEGAAVPPGGAPGSNLDGFERVTFMAAAWIENNRPLFFAMIGLTVLAGIGIALGLVYVQGQQQEASDRLSQGLAAYEVPVEGSPELEAIRQQPDFPEPSRIFESEEERWNAVYRAAESTLQDFDGGPIAVSARLSKASAALNLGEYSEAQSLYERVVATDATSVEFKATAHMGLANALSSQGDIDGAVEAWEAFADLMPERTHYADFESARMVERHARGEDDEAMVEQARDRYDAFMEEHSDSPYAGEVERRKALL